MEEKNMMKETTFKKIMRLLCHPAEPSAFIAVLSSYSLFTFLSIKV
jgi:hypothetical protein